MIRLLMSIISICLLATTAIAKETLSGGTLQAYWRPYWDTETRNYTPDLEIRYISHRADKKPRRIIDITNKTSDAEKITFIQQHFDRIPATFFTYKEGYANQPGTAKVPHVHRYVECGSVYYEAKLTSFTADHHSKLSDQDTLKDEQSAGCGDLYPYVAAYTLKDGVTASLKDRPNDDAGNVYVFKETKWLRKIKTINDEWIYAALYNYNDPFNSSEIKGYIKLKDLDPVD